VIADPTPSTVAHQGARVSSNAGAFSERQVWTRCFACSARGGWASTDAHARRLLVALDAKGACGERAFAKLTALQVGRRRNVQLIARNTMPQLF